jgi:hypothetical protein
MTVKEAAKEAYEKAMGGGLPHIKVLIEGRGASRWAETPWAFDVGGGVAVLDNIPLHPDWRLHDVVRIQGPRNTVKVLLFRAPHQGED